MTSLSKFQKRLGFRISAIFCFLTTGLVSLSRSRETFNLRYIISLKINLSPQGLELIIKVMTFAERFSSHLRCHAFLNVRSRTALHLSHENTKTVSYATKKSYEKGNWTNLRVQLVLPHCNDWISHQEVACSDQVWIRCGKIETTLYEICLWMRGQVSKRESNFNLAKGTRRHTWTT